LLFLAQNATETARRPDPLGELKRSPRPLAAVKGLGPPGRGRGKREENGRRGGEKGRKEGEGKEGWGKGEGMGRKGKGGREKGTGRGPQFKKNDPPSSDSWLRA